MAVAKVSISLPEVTTSPKKLCDACGKEFYPDDPRTLCCSDQCKKEHDNTKQRERAAAKRPGGGVGCLECADGSLFHILAFAHLRRHFPTTAPENVTAEYLAKHPGAELASPMFGHAVRRSKVGRLRINHIPKNRKTRRNGESLVDQRWEMVALRVANKSPKEICRLQMISQPSVFLPLQKMGLTSGAQVTPCFSFGQVFDRASIRALYHASGLKTITSFAQETGVPFPTIEPHLAPRNKRQGVDLDTARNLAEWRHQLFSYLMSNSSTGAHSPGQNRMLRTFFPDLKERYGFLRETLARIGRTDSAWTPEKLKIYLLEQAARGDKSIRQFLPWAVELMPFLRKKLEQLRGPHYQRLALQLIAEWLGTTQPTIADVIRPGCKARPISPDEIRVLILEWRLARATELRAKAASSGNGAGTKVKGKRGHKSGTFLGLTRKRLILAWYFEQQRTSRYAMAASLFPYTNADDVEQARRNTYNLFERREVDMEKISDELMALPESERSAAIKEAQESVLKAGDTWKRHPKRTRHPQ